MLALERRNVEAIDELNASQFAFAVLDLFAPNEIGIARAVSAIDVVQRLACCLALPRPKPSRRCAMQMATGASLATTSSETAADGGWVPNYDSPALVKSIREDTDDLIDAAPSCRIAPSTI